MASTPTNERSLSARVLSGSAWIIASQGAILLLVFLAQRMILSTLTKEENGTLFFERRMTDLIVGVLVDFGMNGILIRRVVQERERAPQIISSAIALRLGMWVVATAVSAVYAYVSGYAVLDVVIWSLYLLIAARTTMLRYAVEAPYRTTSRFHVISLLGIADAMLFTAMIWWWRTSLDPFTVIIAYTISALPGFVILVMLDCGEFIRPSFVRIKEMKALVVESIPVISSVALIGVHASLDTILLEWFGTPRDVGVLGAIYASMGPFLVVLPQAVSLVVMPEIARTGKDDSQRRTDVSLTVIRMLVVATVLLVCVAGPLIPLFIDLVSGGRYAAESIQFYWFLWTAPLVAILVFSQEFTVTVGKQRNNIWIAGGLLIFSAAFGLAFIPSLSSLGAVYSRLATVIAGAAICFVVLRRILGEQLDLLFVLRCCTVIASGMVATTWLSSSVPVLSAIAGSCAVAIVSALASGLIHRSDVVLLTKILRRSR
ncbi:MAG: hypothetical protein IPH49_04340 [Ignavibacteria bacterium]|nr:hypothetical protein [Ignavibacteria bacterium]